MSLENNIERIATALELIAGLMAKAQQAEDKPASTGSQRQRKNIEREEPKVEEPKVEEPKVEEPKLDLDEGDDMGLDDEPAAIVEKVEEFKEDDVRKALKNYRDINGSDATMKVLKDQGGNATGMGSLKPEFYAAVMKVIR